MVQATSSIYVQMPQLQVEKLYNINYMGIQLNKKAMSWCKAQDYQNECIRNYGYCPCIKEHRG